MDDFIFFSYNEKSSVLLIFFFNAIVFSGLLLKKGIEENKNDSKWLALFVLLGGLYICPFMLGYAGWYSKKSYREFLFFVPFQQLFLIGPVLYFYIQSLLNNTFKPERKDLVHFLPAIAYLTYSLIIFITDKLILNEFFFYADGRDKDLVFWYQMAGLISMLFYLILSLKYYKKYRKITLEEVSFADEVAFKWIQHFTLAFSFILILRVVFFIVNPEWGEFGSKYWYYLCFSVLFLYIAITGYSNTVRTTVKSGHANLVSLDAPLIVSNSKANEDQEFSLNLQEWKAKITAVFELEEIYKNPNLTLTDVALHLDTNRNVISNVINKEIKLNFNDFVNKKRTEAVIEMLKKGEHIHSSLLGIALECGFNSKTTFNRAFKKQTGLTPKQYIIKNKL